MPRGDLGVEDRIRFNGGMRGPGQGTCQKGTLGAVAAAAGRKYSGLAPLRDM